MSYLCVCTNKRPVCVRAREKLLVCIEKRDVRPEAHPHSNGFTVAANNVAAAVAVSAAAAAANRTIGAPEEGDRGRGGKGGAAERRAIHVCLLL